MRMQGWLVRWAAFVCLCFCCLEGFSAEVTLIWEPSPEETVEAYRIYYGTSSRSYLGFVETDADHHARLTSLLDGVTYYFAATAVTKDGAESDFSNEVEWVSPEAAEHVPAVRMVFEDGVPSVMVRGEPGAILEVEMSTDLKTWASLDFVVIPASASIVMRYGGASGSARFYRASRQNAAPEEPLPEPVVEPAEDVPPADRGWGER